MDALKDITTALMDGRISYDEYRVQITAAIMQLSEDDLADLADAVDVFESLC